MVDLEINGTLRVITTPLIHNGEVREIAGFAFVFEEVEGQLGLWEAACLLGKELPMLAWLLGFEPRLTSFEWIK